MSTPKRGLGRGLDTLLGTPRPPASGAGSVRVDAIRPNPQQPRKVFDPPALAELERSIRELGVLVPIIVRPLPEAGGSARYELIAGERRWRAAAAARLETIPAIVREADERTSLELAIVENVQRQDLDALEEAMGFQHLIDDFDFTQEKLAERIGKSRPAVANSLRLLALSDAVKARIRSGGLTVGHARALLAVAEPAREALAERIEREGLSVRAVERVGQQQTKRRAPPARQPAPKSPDLEAAEGRLRYALGAGVAIVPAGAGGRVEIRYASSDDLIRIVELLAGNQA